jgi:hypothetical protein
MMPLFRRCEIDGALKGGMHMESRKFEKQLIGRKVLPGLVVSGLLIVLAILAAIFVKPYGFIIAVALIIVSIIVDIVIFLRALTSTHCPQCSRPLKRVSPERAEYPCEACGINWVLETQPSAAGE